VSALWPVEYVATGLAVPPLVELPGTPSVQPAYDVARQVCYPLFQLAWVVCLVWRLRRAGGRERLAISWLAYVVVASALVMVLSISVLDTPVAGLLAIALVPVVAGVTIVRHRLEDIDVVVNKTLVVGAMAVLITLGYVLVVVGLGAVVGRSLSEGPVLPLVATAGVAVAFEPVRRRVQRGADRLVYGARPTPYESLARLSGQLAEGGRDDVFAGLASTVAAAVGASRATLWVGDADDLVAVSTWPAAPVPAGRGSLASLEGGPGTHVRPVAHGDTVLGAVTITKTPGDALSAADDRLLSDLVAQAGLVIELRSAAKRIVTAHDTARRRIERDLHDGAQQQLVTLALGLRSAQDRALATGDEELAGRLERAREGLHAAIGDLRELARGIHPAILTQDGLVSALGFLAERSPLPVAVDVRLDRRLPADMEAAAYFVCAEALTNAARYSGATSVTITGREAADLLTLSISDDGRGGADVAAGSGLQGLADRLATLGGRLIVDSPVGGGSTVRAEIPCG
ncbi:MAG: histidine kinase, partial [Nocardioides sp.]